MKATEKLLKISQYRKWYGDKIERRKANAYKSLLKKGTLSQKKAGEILHILGYEPLQEEVW